MLRTAVSPLGLGLTQGPPTSQAFALDLDTPPGPLGLQLADGGGGGQRACSAPVIDCTSQLLVVREQFSD